MRQRRAVDHAQLSMQRIVWSETKVAGPRHFDAVLPQPQATKDYYRDIAVFTYPTPAASYVIPHIRGKSAAVPGRRFLCAPRSPRLPPMRSCAASRSWTSRRNWSRPAGFIGTCPRATGRCCGWATPAPAWTIILRPLSGRGLECDKLSKQATETQFDGPMGRLIAENRPLTGEITLVSTHIDSWEVGSQNWTPLFRQEFQRLRGYDPSRCCR